MEKLIKFNYSFDFEKSLYITIKNVSNNLFKIRLAQVSDPTNTIIIPRTKFPDEPDFPISIKPQEKVDLYYYKINKDLGCLKDFNLLIRTDDSKDFIYKIKL